MISLFSLSLCPLIKKVEIIEFLNNGTLKPLQYILQTHANHFKSIKYLRNAQKTNVSYLSHGSNLVPLSRNHELEDHLMTVKLSEVKMGQ